MKRRYILSLWAASVALALTALAAPLAGPSTFAITSSTIDSGGGTSSSSSYELAGTIGQPDAGPELTSASFEVVGGFWMGSVDETCPADIVGGNGVVDVFDLIELLSNWGTNGPGANIAEPANDIVDVFDLLELLSAWGAC